MAIVYTNSLPTEEGENDETFCKPFCKLSFIGFPLLQIHYLIFNVPKNSLVHEQHRLFQQSDLQDLPR
jgi:hypothetical protein